MTTGWLLLSRFILNMWFEDIPQPHSWCFFDHQPPRCVSTCSSTFFFLALKWFLCGHLIFLLVAFPPGWRWAEHQRERRRCCSNQTLKLLFWWRGGAMFFWKTSIDRDQFVNRLCLQVVTSFSFTVDSSCVFFSREGTSMKWLHSQRKEHWSNEFRKRFCCKQGFHSSRVASCYQVLRMLSNQTRDVRSKVDETGQLLVLTWW